MIHKAAVFGTRNECVLIGKVWEQLKKTYPLAEARTTNNKYASAYSEIMRQWRENEPETPVGWIRITGEQVENTKNTRYTT